MPISDSARSSLRDSEKKETEQLGAKAQVLIDDFFDSPVHPVIKNSVFGQVIKILEGVNVTCSYAPGQLLGTNSVLQLGGSARVPAALPGGASAGSDDIILTGENAAIFRSLQQIYGGSSERTLQNCYELISPLQGAPTSDQLVARSAVMTKVADGTIEVLDNGELKLQEDLDNQSRTLRNEQAKVREWSVHFGPIERQLRSGGADDATYDRRLIGLRDLASLLVSPDNGGLVVNGAGHVSLPAAPATDDADDSDTNERLELSMRLLSTLKSHSEPSSHRLSVLSPKHTIEFRRSDIADDQWELWESVSEA